MELTVNQFSIDNQPRHTYFVPFHISLSQFQLRLSLSNIYLLLTTSIRRLLECDCEQSLTLGTSTLKWVRELSSERQGEDLNIGYL